MRPILLNRFFSYLTLSMSLAVPTAEAAPTAEEMWQTIQEQQRVIEELKQQLDATAEAVESGSGSSGSSWADSTQLGGYGELHYRTGDGTDQIDFHRFVLYFGHDFSDNIHFFSEVELEHSLAGEGQPGEVELEQAWVEIDITDNHHFRAGLDILPIGLINVTHEPNTFYGVERNAVETRIIPTTWWEAGIGLNGELAPGFNYDMVLHSGLETNSNIRSGRQKVAEANAEYPAGTMRLRYTGTPGLELSGSVQYQSNIGGELQSGNQASLTSFHADYKHSSGFGLRALWAGWQMDDDLTTDGKSSDGWYIEPAYRFKTGSTWEAGVYARYEEIDRGNATTRNEEERKSFGLNLWPHENVVFKFTYESVDDVDQDTGQDNVYVGLGYQF